MVAGTKGQEAVSGAETKLEADITAGGHCLSSKTSAFHSMSMKPLKVLQKSSLTCHPEYCHCQSSNNTAINHYPTR